MTSDGIYDEQDFRDEARFHEAKPQNGPGYIVVRMLKQAADLKKENDELKKRLAGRTAVHPNKVPKKGDNRVVIIKDGRLYEAVNSLPGYMVDGNHVWVSGCTGVSGDMEAEFRIVEIHTEVEK